MVSSKNHFFPLLVGALFTAQKMWMAYCTSSGIVPEHHLTDSVYYQMGLVDSLIALWVSAVMSLRCA